MIRNFVIAVSASLLLAPVANAQTGLAPSVRVYVADLDLRAAAGRETMNRRIAGAARKLCHAAGGASVTEMGRERACYDAAIRSTDGQVAMLLRTVSPDLAALTVRGR